MTTTANPNITTDNRATPPTIQGHSGFRLGGTEYP